MSRSTQGHGGEDPGAIGRRGTYEKDVTLAIARKLKKLIDKEPKMRALLIRDGDYFVPLRKRVEKARAVRADMFVSIHADAFIKPRARGSSVFALSERGATSVTARWLAAKENEADLVGGVNIDVADITLKQVLLDLSSNGKPSTKASSWQKMSWANSDRSTSCTKNMWNKPALQYSKRLTFRPSLSKPRS